MTPWTASQYYSEVKDALDLNEETFISPSEFQAALNKAIKRAEQLIHGIYEDYFLDSADLNFTIGEQLVDYPADIYAHKVRKILYDNGSDKYEIKRFKKLEQTLDVDENEFYRYFPVNSLADGPQMKFYPTLRETSSDVATIWYLRHARSITDDADEVDIPEAQNFILAYVKKECALKEGHPLLDTFQAELKKEEDELVATLTAMVPDEDTEIELDWSYYEEMV